MPIVQVEMVMQPSETLPDGLAARLADELGALWASAPQGTWVKLHLLDARLYAENCGGPLPGVAPVSVTVLKASLPPPERLRTEARSIAAIVARCCDRSPEHVHILFQPPGAGRIAFGGELVEAT